MKNAYLIMAHRQNRQLERLLAALDGPDSQIFLHMDAKCGDFDPDTLRRHVTAGILHFTPERLDVRWGGYSQIRCELLMLKTALGTPGWEYAHLLSAQDLPILRQAERDAVLTAHPGSEWINFQPQLTDRDRKKAAYWYFFQEKNVNRQWAPGWRALSFLSMQAQKLWPLRRNRKVTFYKGSNWFSITRELASYVISREDWIQKTFRFSVCCDELFLQTLVMDSPFRARLRPEGNLRFIDWEHTDTSGPCVLTMKDLPRIQASGCLFARKFDEAVDPEVMDCFSNPI